MEFYLGGEGMESNHPRNVTPRNSVLKTGEATGPHPPPHNLFGHLARCCLRVQVRETQVLHRPRWKCLLPLPEGFQGTAYCNERRLCRFDGQ